ncbi:hypothetical protein NKI51_28975 [Mesorhizobium australicum]|uniref:hypothetical protein n=1 Tax=Mesorhizobium australicum TaxID=536018 RepID=UPI00333D1B53
MSIKSIYNSIVDGFSFAKGILSDEITSEIELETMAGNGFLTLQIRADRQGDFYMVFKSRGGDSTVFVGLRKESAEQIVYFIEQNITKLSIRKDDNV